MPRKPTPSEVETERLFEDSIRRVLAIPPEEAAKIREATSPAKPRPHRRKCHR